ncbi:hypothetical protein ACE3MZ_20055 [Paenibacillus sp. WLX1005]|uniref:hypothetical protein n=1 Tax=Paenibacillus sp. WLX1005 TaxID=3243766 RepID=UPI003983DEAB
MDIVKRINEGNCSIEELEVFLEENNPVILYHTMTYIGKSKYYTQNMLDRLNDLSLRRSPQDKLIGYYKIGDLALATLIKLDEINNKISLEDLNEFDKNMIMRLYEEIDW